MTMRTRLAKTNSVCVLALAAGCLFAANQAMAATSPDDPDIEIVIVTAQRGKAADVAPVKSSLSATEPQSIITRTWIENSVPDTSDYTGIVLVAPSVSSGIDSNGPGLSEKDAVIRGFKDGQYNVRYDGIPFGDTNDPSHHSTSFFPASTVGAVQLDRGPGEAGDLGQASLGGAMDLFSRTLTDDFYLQQKATYGSWNTRNFVTTLQSGKLDWLGGTRITANFQELASDGYLTYERVREYNQFLKFETPLNSHWTISFLATHNTGRVNLPDNDGITIAQARTYGRNFTLSNNPALPTYYGYNTVKKETDFEYLRLNGEVMPGFEVENTGYTYAYINDTLSATDTTQSAVDIANNTYPDWGTSPVKYKGPTAPYAKDVAGYDKLNAYRVWGDVTRLYKDFDFGAVTGQIRAGFWYEEAETDRHRYDRDWTLGFVPNYIEKPPACAPATCAMPDASVQFVERSSWVHYEPFIDIEAHINDRLTVHAGYKYTSLQRRVNAPVGSKTRAVQVERATYQHDLPFLSANYRLKEDWSLYAQYAQGFLIPPLKDFYSNNAAFNNLKPQSSTNYQVGFVHTSNHFVFDGDLYYVRAANYIQSASATINGVKDKVFYNAGTNNFAGIEAEGTYAFGGDTFGGALDGVAAFANGSYNSAKPAGEGLLGGHQIDNVAAWTAAFGLLYNKHHLSLSLINKFMGPENVTPYTIHSYNITNVVIGYEVMANLKAQFGIQNLFDNRNITDISVSEGNGLTDPNSHDQVWWLPERSYQFTLRYTFD